MNYDPADPSHFLNHLPISQEERTKLGQLAPKSAFDLLSRRRSAKDAFDTFVGAERSDAIAHALESLLSASERDALTAPAAPPPRLGARTDKP